MNKNLASFTGLLAGVAAYLILAGGSAHAQDSLKGLTKTTYFVEVQYRYFQWTNGGQTIYWDVMLETESYAEAQELHAVLKEDIENGSADYLTSYGRYSVTTAVDVRLRSETEWLYDLYVNPYYSFKYSLR